MKLVGFISLNKQGNPHRKPRSGYIFHTQAQRGYHPPRIYETIDMAVRQSPVGIAVPVYTEDTENN